MRAHSATDGSAACDGLPKTDFLYVPFREWMGEWLRNPFLRREAWAICVCCGMNRCEMMQGIECAHIQRPMAQQRVTGSLKQIFSTCHFANGWESGCGIRFCGARHGRYACVVA